MGNPALPNKSSQAALLAQKQHVNVGSESDVVRQIPANMVGVLVNDNFIATPDPVVAVGDIIRRNAEIETAEPEALRPASGEMPDVRAAETCRKVPVLPRAVEMIVRIVRRGVVPNPLSVRVHVGRIGVPGPITEIRPLLHGLPLRRSLTLWRSLPLWRSRPLSSSCLRGGFGRAPVGGRTVRRNVSMTNATAVASAVVATSTIAAASFLGNSERGKHQHNCENANCLLHVSLLLNCQICFLLGPAHGASPLIPPDI